MLLLLLLLFCGFHQNLSRSSLIVPGGLRPISRLMSRGIRGGLGSSPVEGLKISTTSDDTPAEVINDKTML